MDKQQNDVLEFHKAMGLEYAEAPKMLSEAAANRRIRLIEEETDEFVEAFERDDLLGMIDGLVDLLYVVYGSLVELGVDAEPFWQEIQRSNMSKVGGKLNEYGKLVKPNTYSPADIKGVFDRLYGSRGKIPVPHTWNEDDMENLDE